VALSLIAILSIVSQAVMQFLIADQKYDSRIVNIAGRQRMLSQKITKLSYYVLNAESAKAASQFRKELEDALSLWERSHVALVRGDSSMGLPGRNSREIMSRFEQIQAHHEAILAAAKSILSSSGNRAVLAKYILEIRLHESAFLKGMDEIVFRYDYEANSKVEQAKWLEIGLISITLVVLMLEALLIFAPATRRIQRDMEDLANREEDLERLFAASPTALLLIDVRSLNILRTNEKATALLGFSIEEIANSNLKDYLDKDYPANEGFLEKINNGESLNEYEVVLLDSRHSVFESLVSARSISFAGKSVFVLGITKITELKKAKQTLEHFATFDEMTGLINRRTGLMMLGKSMVRAERDGSQVTVCFVDLDGLKVANDTFGHLEGDWLIRTAAQVLASVVRGSDAVVRLGGDEFLLILHDCSNSEGVSILARAQRSLTDIKLAQQKPFPVSFSYGLATYSPEKHGSPDELIAEADSQMYMTKHEKKKIRLVSK